MLKLVGTDSSQFYAWELKPGRYVIGRNPDVDLIIPHKTVSRQHAEIEVLDDGNSCFLTDLGSRNGTLVNGVAVSGRLTIRIGDRIMFGQTEFKLMGEGTGDIPSQSETKLTSTEPEKSVVLSIADALKPLPSRVIDQPDVLPTLFDMAKMLILPEPREMMLNRALKLVAKVVPAERLAILFVTPNQNDVYPVATLLPEEKDPGSFTLSRTIVREIMTEKNAIVIGDPEADLRFSGKESIILSQLKSAMAVPLFDEGKVLGILYVDTTNLSHRYNNDYLQLLATFGNIIATRVSNYSLLAERQEKQLLEAELERASRIQKTLLPQVIPGLEGYDIHACQEQARSVGGDLFDLGLLPDGRLLFMVADVSGKGMGAALLMSNILASFRIMYHDVDFDLCQAVNRVSRQMYDYTSPGDFATLFVGLVDPWKNEISFVNAGHNPPLVIRQGGQVEELEASGAMIGAFDFVNWKEERAILAEGDLLFVYTDGVPEALREEEFYSEERMTELVTGCRDLAAEEICRRVMLDINNFLGLLPKSDDITMLIIRRK